MSHFENEMNLILFHFVIMLKMIQYVVPGVPGNGGKETVSTGTLFMSHPPSLHIDTKYYTGFCYLPRFK